MAKVPKSKDLMKNLVINQQTMIKDLTREVVDFVNFASYTYRALTLEEATPEDIENIKKVCKNVIDSYLQGDPNNMLDHQGGMVTGKELLDHIKLQKAQVSGDSDLSAEETAKIFEEAAKEAKEEAEGKNLSDMAVFDAQPQEEIESNG